MTVSENFKTWFNQLPIKYSRDLASELVEAVDEIEVNVFHRRFIIDFLAQFEACINREGVDYLVKLMDDICARKQGENANWESKSSAMLADAELTGSCSIASAAADCKQQYEQWQMVGDAWQKLRNQLLSK